jgi:hypothetical protein
LYQLLDAVMLAGAEMSMGKGDSQQARISISRRRHSWAIAYWYVVLLHNHVQQCPFAAAGPGL